MNNKIMFLIVAVLLLTIFAFKSKADSSPYCVKCTHTYSCLFSDWFCSWDKTCKQITCPPEESDGI